MASRWDAALLLGGQTDKSPAVKYPTDNENGRRRMMLKAEFVPGRPGNNALCVIFGTVTRTRTVCKDNYPSYQSYVERKL
jgi:hypothetical protein